MIGAGFAVHLRSHADQAGVFFVGTALFALTLSLLDLVFVYVCFKESLPEEKRVRHSERYMLNLCSENVSIKDNISTSFVKV